MEEEKKNVQNEAALEKDAQEKHDFVHLHVHTEFSLLDGIARINKLVDITKERGYRAVAITDHGNMYGALQFYEECIKAGIKPILGCEFYICNDLHKKQGKDDIGHIILLAKNNAGYHNLMKLNEIAFCEGFYYKPRIDYDTLAQHAEGVICLSACLAGHIPSLIIQRRFDEADKLALRLKNMFAEGDFYLEVQNHGIPEQQLVNQYLAEMSKKFGIKLVATNDAHYLYKKDAELQDVLMCIQMGKYLDDEDRMKFSTDEFYLKTYEEMREAMAGYEEALDTTLESADKCDVIIQTKSLGETHGVDEKYKLPSNKNHIPKYVTSTGEEPYDFLRRISFEGLHRNYKEITQELLDRLEMELGIIKEQGFVEYFLIVWDYINYANQVGIPVGPGRGSGAGSLVAYCSGITRVDPMRYNLFFERFINKERVSMPDFDVDFCTERRGEVVEYVKRRYGESHVAGIGTFGCMQAKNAIRDVARVMKTPIPDVMKLTKLIPSKLPDGIKKPPVLKYYFGLTGKPENEKFIVPDLREIYDTDPHMRKIIDIASLLEGVPRNTSQHACGILIAPDDVASFVPVAKTDNERVTQYSMIELEHLGLLKMDFLGLANLTDIKKACDYVYENHGVKIDFYNMEYNDQNVFAMIAAGKTDAVFQLESAGMKKFMKELKPNCLEDIIAGVSMYRPGPMDSIPKFVKNKQDPEHVVYDDPCLEDILNVTYGCIVYQEQVMKIVQVMGGYSLGQADNIRRIMGKKQVDKIDAERVKFINGWEDPSGKHSIPGAIKLGHKKEVAEKIFDEMKEFAKYAFNKSHAAAYAYVAYQTAYLKCYYETEFLTAVLNNRIMKADELKKYISFAKSEGIQPLPPHINKSGTYFKTEGHAIRFGLGGLKHVGTAVTDSIIKEREEHGEFKSLEDFLTRVVAIGGVNKKAIECLILSGSFDCFGHTRSQCMAVYASIIDRAQKDKKSGQLGQISFFGENQIADTVEYPNIKEFNKKTLLKNERDIIGVYMSGHPLQDYEKRFENFNFSSDMLQVEMDEQMDGEEYEQEEMTNEFDLTDGQPVVCGGIITEVNRKRSKNGREMCYLKVEDLKGTMEVTVFANAFSKYRAILEEDNLVTIRGKINIRDGMAPSLVADSFSLWKEEEEESAKPVKQDRLCLRFNTKDPDIYSRVKNSISSYPGESKVVIKCSYTDKTFVYQQPVQINNYLLNELSGIIGSENIVVG